jgi:cation:H+ antiporter
VIAVVGSRLTRVADRLADRTGWGEAMVGATLLGAATSLPGITASVTAAIGNKPQLAFSNAIGGIAAQTMFLALADLAYRRSNLEHAAASLANMLQAVLLVFILAVIVFAMASPPLTVLGVHPVTPLLFGVYFAGMKMVQHAKASPMWHPALTRQTRRDEPEEEQTPPAADWYLWLRFGLFATITMLAGYAVTSAVSQMVDAYRWLGESAAGAFLTAVATSLPELVTSIAAVRRGALQLAVGGIIGGNCFDTLFAAVADIAYRDGSLFHAVKTSGSPAPGLIDRELALIAATIAMTTLLLAGLLFRESRGIGFESEGVLVIYVVMALATAL